MPWNRAPVTDALAAMLDAATPTNVQIHDAPVETVNPMCVVIGRPTQVTYASMAIGGIDDTELPISIVGGIETEDEMDGIIQNCRQAILADPTLKGTVANGYPTGERNWRNYTGAGGIQLLTVDLVIQIQM
jgi:hypothetical protein